MLSHKNFLKFKSIPNKNKSHHQLQNALGVDLATPALVHKVRLDI